MTTTDIWEQVIALSGGKPLTVSLSGGNPATQDLGSLIELGHSQGYRFALETQGSVAKDWFNSIDTLTLSPKPPSSDMETDWGVLADCIDLAGDNTRTILKIVVFDDIDYGYAKSVAAKHPGIPLYLQPGNHTPPSADSAGDTKVDIDGITQRMDWLVQKVIDDQWFEAHVLPQLHVLLWGNLRGV